MAVTDPVVLDCAVFEIHLALAEVVPLERIEELDRRRGKDQVGQGEEDGEPRGVFLLPGFVAGVEAHEDGRQDDGVHGREDEVREVVRAVEVALERRQAENVEGQGLGDRFEAVDEGRVRLRKLEGEGESEPADKLGEGDDDLQLGRELDVERHQPLAPLLHLFAPRLLLVRRVISLDRALNLVLDLTLDVVNLILRFALGKGLDIEVAVCGVFDGLLGELLAAAPDDAVAVARVALAAGMETGRRDHIAAFAADVDTGHFAGGVAYAAIVGK